MQLTGTNAGARANGLRLKITAPGTTVRGLAINRFARNGVLVQGSGAAGNKVEGNFIGTDASGSHDLGNSSDGVRIGGAPDNAVGVRWAGGEFVGSGNIVVGNDSDGVAISGTGATGNSVERNGIGILWRNNGTEVALGNSGHGVHVKGASDNIIGDTAAGNEIANNGLDAVYVGSGVGNRILSNSIHGNGELGIDLGPDGVTGNDVDPVGSGDDGGSGANGLQNAPAITVACVFDPWGATTYTVTSGTLNSTPNQEFQIELFNTSGFADPSGYGEGRVYYGSTMVTTDANGNANFQY